MTAVGRVQGFRIAGVHAGLKADGALDMALLVSDTPCVAAGTFTTNLVKAAPVLVDMEILARNTDHIRAVVVNTKCANACTGQQGIDNAHQMARWAAERIGCGEDEVLVLSTGVIGTQLPMEKIKRGIDLAADALADDWERAAEAIMTTDTRPKFKAVGLRVGGADGGGLLIDGQPTAGAVVFKSDIGEPFRECRVAGIAKGAGMIAPNMATMLGIVATDAVVDPPQAARVLKGVVDATFNRVVVDGDMSTNDTVLFLANGASGHRFDNAELGYAVGSVCEPLAYQIVKDGEGATKFIRIQVYGLGDAAAARQIANTIATSPLVKTAFYGGDANWGRIVAAAGRAGVPVQPEWMKLWIKPENSDADPLLLFADGMPTRYDEAQATAIMAAEEILVQLDCGAGSAGAEVWTCDLSHDYVSINGHYRS